MQIIGCDYHPSYQRIAMLDAETGELVERRLRHEGDETRAFYAALRVGARVGIEASGAAQWFEQMLSGMGHELWVGDPARIRALAVRQQKTDARDARHLLELLLSGRFPRVWVPATAQRDLRQLLWHRHKLVRLRTQLRNQLHALAMSQGLRRRRKLWSRKGRQELEGLALGPWAARRRQDLLLWLEQLNPATQELDHQVQQEAQRWPEVRRLMTHPGVGPVVGLAFVLILGPVERFRRSKQVVSYLGLNPREHSSGGRQRLGSISKQGNPMLRWLLVEAAQTAARLDPQLARDYRRLAWRRGSAVAKVAVARKLAVRLYWMQRQQIDYGAWVRTQGSPQAAVVD